MDEKPKVIYKIRKSTGKTVAIVILILLLLASLGFIGYLEYEDIYLDKDKDEKVSRNEMYYSEVEQMMNQIDIYNHIFKGQYPISDFNKVDNQLKLQFGVYSLKETENIKNYYKIDDMKDMYNTYFVSGFKAIYEDIECPSKDGVLYNLNNDTKTYIIDDSHGHGASSMDVNTYYSSSQIEDNKYIINTHILYSNYCTDTCNPNGGYYSSYDDCVEGKNPVTYQEAEYKDIEGDLPTTTHTFIKDKNNFRLESVKIDN